MDPDVASLVGLRLLKKKCNMCEGQRCMMESCTIICASSAVFLHKCSYCPSFDDKNPKSLLLEGLEACNFVYLD